MGKKIKHITKDLFVNEIRPIHGVIVIAIIAIIYFSFNHKVFGTAMSLSLFGYKLLKLIGIDTPGMLSVAGLSDSINKSAFDNPSLMLILGIAFGCVITACFRKEYEFAKPGSKKHILTMIVGGFAVGFGVQGIYGANIGEVYGAISMLSLSGWIVIPFILIGIFIAKPMINKFFE